MSFRKGFLLCMVTAWAVGAHGQAFHSQLYGGFSFYQPTRVVAVPDNAMEERGSSGFGMNMGGAFVWQGKPQGPGFGLGLSFEFKSFGTEYITRGGLFGSGSPLWSRSWTDNVITTGKAEYLLLQLTLGTGPKSRVHVHAGPVVAFLVTSSAYTRTERSETYSHNYIDSSYVVHSVSEQAHSTATGLSTTSLGLLLVGGVRIGKGFLFRGQVYCVPTGLSLPDVDGPWFNTTLQVSVGWCFVHDRTKPVEQKAVGP